MSDDPAASGRWLSIVGIGEDGIDGLSPPARRRIEAARFVFGGRRHLDLAAPLIRGEAVGWPSPFSIDGVLAKAGEPVVVLASGDPFLHGVGNVLSRHLAPAAFECFPAPSAFSLAASRLGWPLAEVATLSLLTLPPEALRPHLHAGARLLMLAADAAAPARIAAFLAGAGFGPSRVTVIEAIGGPRERMRTATASTFDLAGIDPLNLLAIEAEAEPGARILPRAPGLPDDWFESDGQITKREIRALTLSALAPRPSETLWDIGAGSGSVSIEWMLADRGCRAIAIEPRPDRADRILANALAFGVPALQVARGSAPAALAGLATPDAVFIGGGASKGGVIEAALAALPPGGRLVVNGVTLETEAALLHWHARLGGSLARISIDRAAPLAGMTGWEPARPVLQWSLIKP